MSLPSTHGGKPFRAIIVGHNWRGGTNLCIGAEDYLTNSFVALTCSKEDLARFPIGTLFDLVRVEDEKTSSMFTPLTEERLREIRESLNSVQRRFDPWPQAVQELFDEVCRLRSRSAL